MVTNADMKDWAPLKKLMQIKLANYAIEDLLQTFNQFLRF